MRVKKLIMMAGLMAFAINASAQSSGSTDIDTNGWNCVWAEWNPSTFKVDQKGADNQSFTGIAAGYSKAFSIMPTSPTFVEVGLGLQYSFYEEEFQEQRSGYIWSDEYEDTWWVTTHRSLDMWSLKVPINLLYKYDIANSPVSLMPFIGVNVRYNFIATMHDNTGDNYGKTSEQNLFDSHDMGSSKNTWNHFQFGWNIGVKARFGKHILAGLSYGNDLSEIAQKTKISTTTISVGFAF